MAALEGRLTALEARLAGAGVSLQPPEPTSPGEPAAEEALRGSLGALLGGEWE